MIETTNENITSSPNEQPKGLEFIWRGTELGVRREGDTEYEYVDLKGCQGLTGIDGSSVVDASLDRDGHLILTIQEEDIAFDTTKMLTLESGVVTGQDLLDLKNSINRINNNLQNFESVLYTDPPSENTYIEETPQTN